MSNFSSKGNGLHVLLGCGVAVVVLGLLPFVTIGGCLYDSWKNFPERAKKSALEERYAGDLSKYDLLLNEGATTPLKLASTLEDVQHAEDIVYLALELEGDDPSRYVIIDKTGEGGSKSHTLFSGAGYGTRNGIDILILERDVPNIEGVNHLLICWRDPGPPPSEFQ